MKHYLSFDVESIGLFGPPFAFGYVVVDERGDEKESGIYGWDFRNHPFLVDYEISERSRWSYTAADREWVEQNVLPALEGADWDAWNGLQHFVKAVYEKVWLRVPQQYENLTFVSDCPFPVEANFVETMLKFTMYRDLQHSPYPLIDVASVLVGRGLDPTKEYPRRDNELPAHNPVNDARQSVRIMIDAINGNFITKKEPGLFSKVFCPWCGHPLVLEHPPEHEEGPYDYMCTNSTCTWKYGGLKLHHAMDGRLPNGEKSSKPNYLRAPSIDFWSLSFIK